MRLPSRTSSRCCASSPLDLPQLLTSAQIGLSSWLARLWAQYLLLEQDQARMLRRVKNLGTLALLLDGSCSAYPLPMGISLVETRNPVKIRVT